MPRILAFIALVLSALAALGFASPAASAAGGGEVTRFEIVPASGEKSVQITVTGGAEAGTPPVPIRRNFDKTVLEELRSAWGSRTFDVSAWTWEPDCDQQVSWKVTVGSESKIICRDKKAARKMGERQAKVQALMSGN